MDLSPGVAAPPELAAIWGDEWGGAPPSAAPAIAGSPRSSLGSWGDELGMLAELGISVKDDDEGGADCGGGDVAVARFAAAHSAAAATFRARRRWADAGQERMAALLADRVASLTPTPAATARLDAALATVAAAVRSGLATGPGRPPVALVVVPYGSYVAGLHSPGGDLDLALDTPPGTPLPGKRARGDLLRTLAAELARRRALAGRPQFILHARVPIVKLRLAGAGGGAAVECDVSCGARGGALKSGALAALAAAHPTYAPLARLAKAWAKEAGVGDASMGGFNSFSISLLAAHHLQAGSALPPLCALLDAAPHEVHGRPMAGGRVPGADEEGRLLEVARARAAAHAAATPPHPDDSACLTTQIGTLLACLAAMLGAWRGDPGARARVRVSPWAGGFRAGRFDALGRHVQWAGVEDPFDAGDNTARSLDERVSSRAAAAAAAGADALARLATEADAEAAFRALFGTPGGARAPGLAPAALKRPVVLRATGAAAKGFAKARWRTLDAEDAAARGAVRDARKAGPPATAAHAPQRPPPPPPPPLRAPVAPAEASPEPAAPAKAAPAAVAKRPPPLAPRPPAAQPPPPPPVKKTKKRPAAPAVASPADPDAPPGFAHARPAPRAAAAGGGEDRPPGF